MGEISVKNKRGQWVPAVPEPYHLLFRKQCGICRQRFWTEAGYNGHYALVHILGL